MLSRMAVNNEESWAMLGFRRKKAIGRFVHEIYGMNEEITNSISDECPTLSSQQA